MFVYYLLKSKTNVVLDMQTIKEIQEEILEDFDMFEDWMRSMST